MPINKYSLIPKPCKESELRIEYPWIGKRPILIPVGWLGLVKNACGEIEAAIAPDNAADLVKYFFATVRDSRLRLFLHFNTSIENNAQYNAIESLINETQINSEFICEICGKLAKPSEFHRLIRGTLPNCGEHHRDGLDDIDHAKEASIISDGLKETKSTPAGKEVGGQTTKAVEDSSSDYVIVEDIDESTLASIKLYDVESLRILVNEVSTRYRDRDDVTKIKGMLNKLIKAGEDRILKPFPNDAVAFLNQLELEFPNFSQVIDMLRGINALSDDSEVMRIPAILLLGPPGVGKTMFAQALANAMQVPFKVVRMENQQAGAGLVGTADFWSNSKPGAVFNILTGGDCGNPVLVVDEVDKAANDSRYDPLNGLYSLLEPNSACTFTDESLPDVSINASKITWLLTANYKNLIPEPILSRVLVFEIPSPDQSQSVQVAERIYQLLLSESNTLKTRFACSILTDEVAQLLSTMSPRKMRLAIEIALGRAALAGRNMLIAEDIDVVEKVLKMKIGFI